MSTTTVHDVREQAAQRFAQLGWPTPRQEEWKYTNVAPIARVAWKLGAPVRVESHDFRFFDRAAAELVFVNGHLVEGGRTLSAPTGRGAQRAPFEDEHYAR